MVKSNFQKEVKVKKLAPFLLVVAIGLMGCMPLHQQQGYANEADFKFAQTLSNSTPQRISGLKSYGITSKEDFDKLLTELKAANYSDNTNWDTIFSYLKDRKDAAAAGIPILKQRDARLKAEKAAADKAAAEEQQRKIDFAKNYPFTAILSCEMNGRNFRNIAACFSDRSGGTELNLTNGSEVNVYKMYQLQSLGREQEDGLHIPLRRNFSIKAQNASEHMILRLKIIDTATGRVVDNQAGGRWKVVAIRN
jgi:hypothetical protein